MMVRSALSIHIPVVFQLLTQKLLLSPGEQDRTFWQQSKPPGLFEVVQGGFLSEPLRRITTDRFNEYNQAQA